MAPRGTVGRRPRRGRGGSAAGGAAAPNGPANASEQSDTNDEQSAHDQPTWSEANPPPADMDIGGLPLETSDSQPATGTVQEESRTEEADRSRPTAEGPPPESMDVDVPAQQGAVSSNQASASMPPPSRPSNPSRGSGRGGRARSVATPSFSGRRSKAERDAAQAAQAARRGSDEPQRPPSSVRSNSDRGSRGDYRDRGGRGRGDRGGRGGRGGRIGDFRQAKEATGIFGSGQVTKERFERPRGPSHAQSRTTDSASDSAVASASGTQSVGASSKSGNRKPKIKTEDGESDATHSKSSRRVKKEEDFSSSDESSSEDETERGKRRNIDHIDLTHDSDDGSIDTAAGAISKSMRPVRVTRVEHQDRAGGVSVAKSSKQDRKRTMRQLKAGDPGIKGKHRPGDLDSAVTERRWKGAYSDDDSYDDDEEGVAVKEEPTEDGTAPVKPPQRPEEKKPRSRRHPGPDLQTPEERAEHARHMANLETMVHELSYVTPLTDVDTPMGNTSDATPAAAPDHRAEKVYLFQFPPVLPDLHTASSLVKPEPDLDAPSALPPETSTAAPAVQPATTEEEKPIKPDPAGPPSDVPYKGAHLAPGSAGKLRVHASGRVTMDWGGTALQMGMGTDMDFLQDVVLTRVFDPTEGEREQGKGKAKAMGEGDKKGELKSDVVQGDGMVGGEAMALGQVRGKFVVTPDWGEIL